MWPMNYYHSCFTCLSLYTFRISGWILRGFNEFLDLLRLHFTLSLIIRIISFNIVIALCPSSVVGPSTFLLKWHFLLNQWASFHHASQECSLWWSFWKLPKDINSMQNSGCHGNQKEKLKNHLLTKRKP